MNNKSKSNSDRISKEKKDRNLNNLINTVENHTRTERYLEQYSHIGDPEYKEKARDKQHIREKQINELKQQILDPKQDKPTKQEQIENLKENYQFGQGYIQSNKNHMNETDLRNLQRRQENRKVQLNNLEENIKRKN